MCDFCNLNASGFSENELSKELDCGVLGKVTVLCGLEREVHEPNKLHLGVWLGLDTQPDADSDNLDGIIQDRVICSQIKYCPMCGRYLSEDTPDYPTRIKAKRIELEKECESLEEENRVRKLDEGEQAPKACYADGYTSGLMKGIQVLNGLLLD